MKDCKECIRLRNLETYYFLERKIEMVVTNGIGYKLDREPFFQDNSLQGRLRLMDAKVRMFEEEPSLKNLLDMNNFVIKFRDNY